MAITVAELQAVISADTADAQSGISRFSQMLLGMGPIAATATAGIVGAFAGLAGSIGKSVFEAAEEYDKAFDHIRIKTGLVGDDAKKLQEAFKDVFTSVPASAKDVVDAVTMVHQRLGAEGQDLRKLATQQVELARITGASLKDQLSVTTRLLGDWEIAKGKELATVDQVFKISQQTGVAVNEIAKKMVQYGAPLRELGVPFENAAAMIAKFEKEGVNMGTALSGLRQALSKFAKEGVTSADEAFTKLIDSIKNAPSDMERVGLASAAFGKKAGPDMAELIKQGRLSVEDLIKTVNASSETIIKAATDTQDYGEKWQILKNQITDAMQPLGQFLFQLVNDLVQSVQDLYKAYQENWGGLKKAVEDATKDITSFYNDNKVAIDALATAVAAALGIMAKLWAENAKSVLDSISLITLSMRLAMGDWEGAWKQINEIGKREQEQTKKNVDEWKAYITKKTMDLGNEMIAIYLKLRDATIAIWERIKSDAKAVWDGISDSITGPIKKAYDFLKGLDWRSIFENLTKAAQLGLKTGSPPQAARWITEIGDAAGKAAVQTKNSIPTFADSYKTLSSAASKHLPAVAQEWLKLGETVLDVIGKIKKIDIGSVLSGAGGGSGSAGGAAGGFLGALGKIGAAVGGIASIVGSVGTIITTIKDIFGIKSAFQKAMEAEQLAQARLQTRQSQEQVLQMIEQTKQSWIETLDKGRALLESISFYSKVPKVAFNQFFSDMNKLFKGMVELAKKWKLDATVDIKTAAENLGAGVALLSQLPAALDGIGKYLGTPDASFNTFFAAAAKYFDKLAEFLDTIPKSTAKAISKFSNWLKSGVDLLGPLTEGLKGLLELKDLPTDQQFALVNQAIDKIIANIGELGGKFEKGMLKQMAFFAEKAGSAMALVKDTVEVIKATVNLPMVSDADASNLVNGLTLFINKLGQGLASLDTEQLTRISAIAQTILPIAAAIKAWADTSAAVRGYTSIAAESWDAIVQDFTKAIQLMGVLIGQATQFESMATLLETKLKSGAQHLADGVSAMTAGILGTASALQSAFGHIQGGTETGTMGTQSLTLGSTAQTNINIGGITINGSDPKGLAVLKALAELLGPGTGLDAAIANHS